MRGPVQVLVVGYEQPAFTGEVLAELARLSDAGVVRLVDVLLVTRAADGTFHTLEVSEVAAGGLPDLPQGRVALVASLLGQTDESTDDLDAPEGSVWSLADTVPAGTTAAVALIEHLWATPLRAAIARAGGVPVTDAWVHPLDLVAIGLLAADELEPA